MHQIESVLYMRLTLPQSVKRLSIIIYHSVNNIRASIGIVKLHVGRATNFEL